MNTHGSLKMESNRRIRRPAISGMSVAPDHKIWIWRPDEQKWPFSPAHRTSHQQSLSGHARISALFRNLREPWANRAATGPPAANPAPHLFSDKLLSEQEEPHTATDPLPAAAPDSTPTDPSVSASVPPCLRVETPSGTILAVHDIPILLSIRQVPSLFG